PSTVVVKSPAETDEQTTGSLIEMLTDGLPPVAATVERAGATVSTVTARVVAADAREALSTARKATVWGPSARAVPGRNVHGAEAVPQPVQVTPVVEKAALSTLASTRARPLPVSAALPP